jgi:hypothetical protein
MRYSVVLLAPVCLLGAWSGVASAQTKASSDQLAAATELLLAMQLDKTTGPAIENTVDMQIKANPSMARNRKVMLEFLTKHMGWEAIKDGSPRSMPKSSRSRR